MTIPNKIIQIGTRRSKLAMRQTEMTIDALQLAHPELVEAGRIEIVPMQTSGDANQKGSLADCGGKGLFAKEIEQSLLDGSIDIAVHSMKDMETVLPDGLVIPCMLPRSDIRDVLISRHDGWIDGLPENASFGTSSVRRKAQLLHKRNDLKIIEFRGNLQTRLQKLKDGVADATLLAYAGIIRLGLEDEIRSSFNMKVLEVSEMLPAGSQGAIGVECRADDYTMMKMLESINHSPTHIAVTCERSLLNRVDGSCHTPLAVRAVIEDDIITLEAELYSPDGSRVIFAKDSATVNDADKLGQKVGKILLRDGGDILKASK